MSRQRLYSFIEGINANKANLWSYLTLQAADIMCRKARDEREVDREVDDEKRKILEKLVEVSRTSFNSSKLIVLELLRSIEEALIANRFEVRLVKVRLSSRGLFGASETFGKALFEVGLSFNPLLNLPFLPSSSLKGAVRSAYQELHVKKYGNRDLCEEECKRIFGEPGESIGLVGFTDAYPIETGEGGFLLYPDVMTPHYREGVETELDVKPTPLVYLTVAPGTVFQFYVFWKSRGERRVKVGLGYEADFSSLPTPSFEGLALLDMAILYAMKVGVGAKSSLGYSSFEVLEYRKVR